jgi:hypothetical protein
MMTVAKRPVTEYRFHLGHVATTEVGTAPALGFAAAVRGGIPLGLGGGGIVGEPGFCCRDQSQYRL